MLKSKQTENPELLKAIDRVYDSMSKRDPETEEYRVLLLQLERLEDLRLSQPDKRKPIDPNALIAAGASLAGILVIIGYEHAHVVTSKALGFVLKK